MEPQQQKQDQNTTKSHLLVLPFPAQGHIKPMLLLSQLLARHSDVEVSFILTEHNYDRLHQTKEAEAVTTHFPNIRFVSVPDGLSRETARSGREGAIELLKLTSREVIKKGLRDYLTGLIRQGVSPLGVTMIADGIMSFAIDVGEEFKVCVMTFRTFNASCTWVYLHLQKLIDEGEVPFQGETTDMDMLITTRFAGLEGKIRRRDLPGICRLKEPNHQILQFFVRESLKMRKASALILNTFNALEPCVVAEHESVFPKVYTLGPLHGLLETFGSTASKGSLWKEDRSCITWLDLQPQRSVVYVSFGSLAELSRDEFLELLFGLVNSGKRFLWVMRPDLIMDQGDGGSGVPVELEVGIKERGLIVEWVPQLEVLAHKSIGGFLTHGGWNSILESIFAGVPMICWPQFGDQQVNSRCVGELWKLGVDMKDTCDRSTVEKMVRDVMDGTEEEILRSVKRFARLASESVREGGSSYSNLNRLIEDIRNMTLANSPSLS